MKTGARVSLRLDKGSLATMGVAVGVAGGVSFSNAESVTEVAAATVAAVEEPTGGGLEARAKTARSLAEVLSGNVPGQAHYNVLQIVWDTTRAANIGAYGYGRATTPYLDRWAEEAGVVFERCHAEGSWTSPSVATLFTGVIPQSHKMHTEATRLSDEWKTTAEILSENGYRTLLATGNGMLTSRDRNFGQGFDKVVFQPRPDSLVTDEFLAWVDSTGSEPFFGHLQYFAAHGPYAPSETFDSLFVGDEYYGALGDAPKINAAGCVGGLNPGIVVDSLLNLDYYVAQYDALIRETDVELERLMEGLESRGLLDSTLVILTSDHGEMLAGEHNLFFCHATFFEGNSHVPLAIWLPPAWQAEHGSLGGFRDHRNVGLVDLLPTTLDLLGLPVPWPVQGTSLFSSLHPNVYLGGEGDRRYVGFGDMKMIHYGMPVDSEELVTLYETIADPAERIDVAGEDTLRTARVSNTLKRVSGAAEGLWLEGPPGVYYAEDFEDLPAAQFKLYLERKPTEDLYWTIRSTGAPDSSQALYGYAAEAASQSFETGALVVVDDPQRSYSLTTDLKLEQGDVGLAIGYQPWTRVGYRVRLQPDRMALYTVWTGTEERLAAAEISLDPEQWYRIRMRARSGTVTVEIDGVERFRAFEPRWELIGGGTMFTVSPGTGVWVDNLELARP